MAELARVRFKFLLGELHLHSWRPLLWPTPAPADEAEQAPRDATLPTGAEGVWWQHAAATRFALGATRVGAWLRYVPRQEKLHYVDLNGSFEDYLSAWSSKARYNLKRSVRKLQEQNSAPVLELASEPAQMEAFLRQAAAISQDTYQAKLLQSGLGYSDALVQEMQQRAAQGEARGYLLRDQGEAIAFAWCAGRGEHLTYEVIGYKESAAALSPGSVLLYLILEDLFALQRFKLFDFGVGDAPYKRQFASGVREFADAYFFPATLGNQLRVRLHWRLDRFSSGVGALLDRWGLKARVKRWLRALR